MTDKIHPTHYDGDACMRCIHRMTLNMSGSTAFCVGQAVKYLWRCGTKAGESDADDRGKALWYLEWTLRQIRDQASVSITNCTADLVDLARSNLSAREMQPELVMLADRQ